MIVTPRARAILNLVLPLAFLAGCDESTGPDDDITGTYVLVSANGRPLPAIVFQEGNFKEEALEGSLKLTADRKFSVRLVFRRTEGTTVTTGEELPSGTYTVSGSSISFVDSEGTTPGVIAGNRITVTAEGEDDGPLLLVFQK